MNAPLPNSLKAAITVRYKRGAAERYELTLDQAAEGALEACLVSPATGELRRTVRPRTERAHDTVTTRALQTVVECFFGDVHAVPRIVGAPEWTQVTLELQALRESRSRRMLFVELKADSPQAATLERTVASRVAERESVRLCPEDADPVYAVTRLALVGHAAAAARERYVEHRPTMRAPLLQPPSLVAMAAAAA